MKKMMLLISTGLLAGQLMAQSGNKRVPPPPPPPPPPAMAMNAPAPAPPPPPQLELDKLAPPPSPPLPPAPPKAPKKVGKKKVLFVAPVIVKDKEIKPVK